MCVFVLDCVEDCYDFVEYYGFVVEDWFEGGVVWQQLCVIVLMLQYFDCCFVVEYCCYDFVVFGVVLGVDDDLVVVVDCGVDY